MQVTLRNIFYINRYKFLNFFLQNYTNSLKD